MGRKSDDYGKWLNLENSFKMVFQSAGITKLLQKFKRAKQTIKFVLLFFFITKKYFKGSDNMIYKPQNVYPHNTAIDASEDNSFSFIFNGDHLKG